jgi:hypothetical protein
MVSKDEISFVIDGRLYVIRREGNIYFMVDEGGNKYKIKEYNVDCDSVIIVSDKQLPIDWQYEVDNDEM